MQLGASLASPSRVHPFRTDSLGRDVLSQTIYGARVSLTIGFVSVGLALLGGVPLGALSGYAAGSTAWPCGGWTCSSRSRRACSRSS